VTDNSSGFWAKLKRPSTKYSLLALLSVGFVAGVFFWGGFNTAMEATNTLEFCIGCHEMKDNVYQEYKKTIHYSNRTGVRAYCSDCHVPKDWGHKMMRKMQASKELYGKVMGTISTPEKFEAKRLELATNEWNRMKAAIRANAATATRSRRWTSKSRRHARPRCTRSVRRTSRPASTATRASRIRSRRTCRKRRRRGDARRQRPAARPRANNRRPLVADTYQPHQHLSGV
jgi:nitrate/TMAO reductase-like tetraheme cytochrome c subunit